MNMLSFRMSALAALTAFSLACSASPSGTGLDGGVGNLDASATGYLAIIGSAVVATPAYSEVELTVRYSDGAGNGLTGAVSFSIEGEGNGASLEQLSVTPDAEGLATVRLRAGDVANFPVVASAPAAADPVAFTVNVSAITNATLEIVPRYVGTRAITNVEIGVFGNYTCADLATRIPSARATAETSVGVGASFTDLDVDVSLAVYVFGINESDQIAAYKCEDVTIDRDTTLEVLIGDVPATRGGLYSTVETVDVTDGFNDRLDTILEVLTGLTTDPSAYIVDQALASVDLPSWARAIVETPAVRAQFETAIDDAIAGVTLPAELVTLAGAGADLDRAFSSLTFVGTLDLGEPAEFGEATATHTLTAVHVTTDDGVSSYPLTDASATVGVDFLETITIDPHTFHIAFGEVVGTLLDDVLLPLLPGSPHGVDALIGSLVDCTSVGAYFSDDALLSTAIETACEIGVDMVVDRVDYEVTQLWNYDDLTLRASGTVSDDDGDYASDSFSGTADATWTGDDGTLEFTGTIEGARLDDDEAPLFRLVRDALNADTTFD